MCQIKLWSKFNLMEAPTLFTNIRDWLEIFYFISGIIVMLLAGFGLWQLKLAKDQISLAKDQLETSKNIFKTQSKRAAVEAAVLECRNFSETVIKESMALDKYCKQEQISYFDDVIFTNTDDGFTLDCKNVDEEDANKLQAVDEIITRFMNGMEAHSLYFLSGIADEKIAFHTNAKAFIELAEKAFKVIPLCNIDDDDIQPVKTLYFMWYKKVEAKKLKIKKEEIEKELSDYKEVNLRSIGT